MLEILPIAQTCLSVEGGTVATVTCDPTQPYQSFFMTTDPATNEAYMESIMQLGTCLSAAPVPMIVPALQSPPQLGPRSDSASSLDLYNCQSAFPPNAMSQLWQGRTDGFVVSDASSNIYEMFENGTVKVFYIEPAFGGAVMANVKCDEFCVAISKQGHIYGWNDTVPFLVSSSVFLDIAPVSSTTLAGLTSSGTTIYYFTIPGNSISNTFENFGSAKNITQWTEDIIVAYGSSTSITIFNGTQAPYTIPVGTSNVVKVFVISPTQLMAVTSSAQPLVYDIYSNGQVVENVYFTDNALFTVLWAGSSQGTTYLHLADNAGVQRLYYQVLSTTTSPTYSVAEYTAPACMDFDQMVQTWELIHNATCADGVKYGLVDALQEPDILYFSLDDLWTLYGSTPQFDSVMESLATQCPNPWTTIRPLLCYNSVPQLIINGPRLAYIDGLNTFTQVLL